MPLGTFCELDAHYLFQDVVKVGPALRWNASCSKLGHAQWETNSSHSFVYVCVCRKVDLVARTHCVEEIIHINEDTWHGAFQAAGCGGLLWHRGGIGEVSAVNFFQFSRSHFRRRRSGIRLLTHCCSRVCVCALARVRVFVKVLSLMWEWVSACGRKVLFG